MSGVLAPSKTVEAALYIEAAWPTDLSLAGLAV